MSRPAQRERHELCDLFGVPRGALPTVVDTHGPTELVVEELDRERRATSSGRSSAATLVRSSPRS